MSNGLRHNELSTPISDETKNKSYQRNRGAKCSSVTSRTLSQCTTIQNRSTVRMHCIFLQWLWIQWFHKTPSMWQRKAHNGTIESTNGAGIWLEQLRNIRKWNHTTEPKKNSNNGWSPSDFDWIQILDVHREEIKVNIAEPTQAGSASRPSWTGWWC